MTSEFRAYNRLYSFLVVVMKLLFRFEIVGLENIPDGPAVVCANHSSNLDAVIISLAAGRKHHIRYMAKIELFRIPILSSVIKAIGAYPVDRGNKDIRAIRTSMKILKAGEKIGIFPEGTRVRKAGDRPPKSGAIRIADQMGVPIVPVYLPRKKRLFSKIRIEFKKAYTVNPDRRKLSYEQYVALSEELMDKINASETVSREAAS